jgi:hypothetical protein
VLSGFGEASAGGALLANVRKAIQIRDDRAESILPYFKSAPKVYNFSLNLQGIKSAVTVDTHALQAALHNVEITLGLNATRYAFFADAYRQAAESVDLAPCEFQAIVWLTWQQLYPRMVKNRIRRKPRKVA